MFGNLFEFFISHNPETVAVALPAWLDLASVVVGGISGVCVARARRLDPIGFVGLALLCGLGGGLIRDTMMQVGLVYMLASPYAVMSVTLIALFGFLFPGPFDKYPHFLEWFDIVSVGLFCLIGTDKAIVFQLLPVSAILMGTITGVGGGMLRDVFLGEVPKIFKPSNYYAFCALAGSSAYYLAVMVLHLDKFWASLLCVGITLLLRRLSLRYNILSPVDVNLGPHVHGHVRRLSHHVKRRTTHHKESQQ